MLLLLISLACQGPLGDRHQLDGTRIAALRVSPAGGSPGTSVEPTAIITVEGSLWSDTAPDLSWYWVMSDDGAVNTIDADSRPDGTGPAPSLSMPEEMRRLALLAKVGGQELRAFIDLEEAPAPMLEFTQIRLSRVEDESLATLDGPDLSLDSRMDWTTESVATFEPGDILRIEGIHSGDETALRTRWSATSPFGTFFELDSLRTDWVAGELVIDDGKAEEGTAAPTGSLSVLGLLLNDRGGTDYQIRDLHLGSRPDGIETSGRWIATDSTLEAGETLVSGTLVADDSSTTGLRLEQSRAISEEDLPATDPYGIQTLNCVGITNEPFNPNWLAEHRCTRDQVVGHTVVLRAQ